ncbi:MAG: hypothetical protein RMK84_04255 [Oscillochloridaceae bacterium]|nr:hypothetical protein [Chloroflexaceae bacterium]MDW8389315.1 hypothetical protein [Oscillochloridaceae bacterium]
MEQEIDLRPYAQAVLRRWRWIALAVLAAVVVAAIITMTQPRLSRARASVLIDPVISQVVLDGRFTERDTGMFTNASTRRQALIDLASSPVLEARVLEQLGQPDLQSGDLLPRVEVRATSDLLTITATGTDAAEAGRLAQLWGQTYEALVRELYGGGSLGVERIDQELNDARARHAEARRAIDAFLSQGELTRTSQEVARLRELLAASRQAQQELYRAYLSRIQQLSLVLEDARILRAQIERGEGAPADALAALVVRLRAAGGENLPVDLTISSPETLTSGREAALSDLERLTAVIESERDRLVRETEQVAAAIVAGDASAVGLDAETRSRYERELAAAEGRLADLMSEQRVLSQTLDLALNTLSVLQAKRDEQVIAQATSSVSVRYLGDAPVSPSSRAVLLARNGLIAAVLAGFLVITLILVLEIARQVRQAPAPPPAPRGEPAPEQPSASD